MYEAFKHYYELVGGHEDDVVLHKLFLKAGEYIGQGEESCIIGQGLGVLSVSLYPQDQSKVQELQTISTILETVDPEEKMFLRPRNIRLEKYADLSSDVLREYAKCLGKAEIPALSPDSTLLVTESSRATGVTNEFILSRLKILKGHLAKLHEYKWVHGDIHEGNIMRKGDDLVIIDWGKARPLTDESLRSEMKLVDEMRQRLVNDQGKGKAKKKRDSSRSPASLEGVFSPKKGLFEEGGGGLFGFRSPGKPSPRGSVGKGGKGGIGLSFESPARAARGSPARADKAPPGSTGVYRRGLQLTAQSPARAAPAKSGPAVGDVPSRTGGPSPSGV